MVFFLPKMYFKSFVYFNEFYLNFPRFEMKTKKSLGKERELFSALITTEWLMCVQIHSFISFLVVQQRQRQLPFTFFNSGKVCGIA